MTSVVGKVNGTMQPGPSAFSSKLTTILASRNKSQRAIATAMGLTRASVSDWCRGQSIPAPETVFALEEALGIDPGELSRELGYLPLLFDTPPRATTRDCIATDPDLDDVDRELVMLVYEKLARDRRASRRRSRRSGH